jgi:hypothetical protein
MMTADKYADLIQGFLRNEVTAQEFESLFLNWFKSDPGGMARPVFQVLDSLFAAVDAYWPECKPGQETKWMISEEELRRQAAKALEQLNRILREGH